MRVAGLGGGDTVQNRHEIEMEAGAWAQRGLVPAWKGEVVHPGAPESKCVYKIWQFAGSCQCSRTRAETRPAEGHGPTHWPR
jgi:hypothetical protein